MRGKSKIYTKINPWKEKAKDRGKMLRAQKRRIEDLEYSRQLWKQKYNRLKLENQALLKAKARGNLLETSCKIRQHSYPGEVIQLCLQIRNHAGCSYRSCVKVIQVMFLLLNLELKVPSFWSIRNWEMKLGYAQINQVSSTSSRWMLIVDESLSVGGQKLLLILGVDLSKYSYEKALSLSEVQVLEIGLQKSWKSQEIEALIQRIIQRGYKFDYACCDNGNNLRKSLVLLGLEHIEDCGHKLGSWLEKQYKKQEEFIRFCAKINQLKKQLILSKYAAYLPPKHRTKGRFLNIDAIAK